MFTEPGQFFPSSAASYEIDQSIRFESGDDALLSRSLSSSGSLTTWTLSCWVKRGRPNANENGQWFPIWSASDGSSTSDYPLSITDASTPGFWAIAIGGQNWTTSQRVGDVAAWYHAVVVWDSTNGTAGDRMRLYINGSRVTSFSATGTVSSSLSSRWNSSSYSHHRIGSLNISAGPDNKYLFDGYLAEMVFLDGTATTDASSFGEYNSDGVWIPKDVSDLTFGTNGFYVDGRDSSDLGDDESGNGNDWSSSGLAAADQMSDTPTNNHCTLNPLWVDGHTLSDGNLVASAAADSAAIGTMAFDPTDSDGFYFEAKVTTAATYPNVGIRTAESPSQIGAVTNLSGNSTGRYAFAGSSGNFTDAGSGSSYGSAWAGTADKVIGVLVKAGALYFSIDGTIQNSGTAAKTGLTGYMLPTVFYDAGSGTTAAWEMRFDASDWSTTPTGYKAISTANLPDPAIADPSAYFQSTLYTGNGSTQSITNTGNSDLQGDLIWIKNRSAADSHVLTDAVRGATKIISSDATTAESTDADTVTSFASDGFALGADDKVNTSSENYVAWQWKESATAGFDIVTDTGTGSAHTISHSLGVTPEFILRKDRTATSDPGWIVWHKDLGGANYYLNLHDTGARDTSVNYWNNTLPTSSVFSVGASNGTNQDTKTFVTYLFNSVPGFSSFGGYTGNGNADGVFVHTGFSPSFIMYKVTSTTDSWEMYDTTRQTFNVYGTQLKANLNNAETDDTRIDILSNGFKARSSNTAVNAAQSYIFAAFAQHPFGGDGVAPATAR